MTDLPTRKQALQIVASVDAGQRMTKRTPLPILRAYANGELIDRTEAIRACVDLGMSFGNTKHFAERFPVAAAVGEET